VHPDEYWQSIMPAYNIVYGGVVLPWEWNDIYRLRNTVYPFYLAGPLYLLKMLNLDFATIVRVQPYLTHYPLVVLHDYFYWKVAKRVMGKDTARVAMLMLVFSMYENLFLVRCFTNSLESIFTVVSFYYFIDQEKSFTKNTVIVTALITASFMMRNTSPIGWIPLLAIKVLFHESFLAYLLAAVIIAVPIIGINILFDSLYFDPSLNTWTLTSYNFLQVNVVDGISQYFGVDNWHWYITYCPQAISKSCYLLFYIAPFYHIRASLKSNQWPYMTMYVVFYFAIFSLIPHKEVRFLLPALPFIWLMVSQFVADCLVSNLNSWIMRKMIFLGIVVESMNYVWFTMFENTNYR